MDWRFALVSTFLFVAAAFVVGTMLDVRNSGPMLSEGVAVELEIGGEIIGPGVECLQFRMDSGEQISLSRLLKKGFWGVAAGKVFYI